MKLWHWKSHWKFLWHWKDTETTLKNIYKGNHSDNSGLSHWNIFLCCSRTLKSHWKVLNHTEKFSALLIPFVPRFFSVTVNFQCDFQCHNFIVWYPELIHVWKNVKFQNSFSLEVIRQTFSLQPFLKMTSYIKWNTSAHIRGNSINSTGAFVQIIYRSATFL